MKLAAFGISSAETLLLLPQC